MQKHPSHSHSHNHRTPQAKNLLISIILNLGITIAQAVGGIVSGSLALLSDALHNFTDVISLVISYIAHLLSRKKASTLKTFGYKRAEIIAAFVNASTLIVIAILLMIEAVKRFFEPQEIESSLVIWLSVLGITFNGLSVWILKNDADKSINMKSAYIHLLTDMLASVAVLVGGLLMLWYKIYWIDSVLTFVISIYLLFVGYDLLRKSTRC